MPTDQALRNLIRISRQVGEDSSLVLGGGGNTSAKSADGRFMYIKASGTALKDMAEDRGWRRMRLAEVRAILEDPVIARLDEARREVEIANRLLLSCDDAMPEQARPSVESHLHALLGRYVIHLHPTAVGAFVSARHGKEALLRLFQGQSAPPLWVPYANPGYMLARRTARLIASYQQEHGRPPAVLFLEKHGVFVTAATPQAAIRLVRQVVGACEAALARPARAAPRPPREEAVAAARLAVRRALWEATGAYFCAAHFLDEEIAGLLAANESKRLASLPALTPDELVYANGSPLWGGHWRPEALARQVQRRIEHGEKPPRAFIGPDVGLIAAGPPAMLGLVRDIAVASLQVRLHAARFGGASPLTARQRDFIAKWEAESYRHSLAAGRSAGELAGRIAVVTGAGSGLGRSIAMGLARAGAAVALADVDLPATEETARLIAAETPQAAALPLPCDVTSEDSVEGGYQQLLARWGGLDILVNAAGIAPAYPLVELPADRWRATLEVNLTGYFLMARAAARIMIRQGMGGSIINLSSKSGLEASRDNTPYNATKAGEIHMARGWALELGAHGIRVNAVAPGNVFAGSRIWNPEYIRACARKYGIKPEEVISYYVNKTALRREITGHDVANVVVFLCSDRARTITGQTVVADAGQVMVR